MSVFRTRAALGLRPLTAPLILFLPIGMILGPSVLGVLSTEALGYLDIVVPVGLATLGVFIGLALGREGRAARVVFAAASSEAIVTIVTVAAAVLFLLTVWSIPIDVPYALVAAALGICASASAAPAIDKDDDPAARIAGRVADLDDVVPIVFGGLILGAFGPSSASAVGSLVMTIGLGLAVGLAGWLLIERADSPAPNAACSCSARSRRGRRVGVSRCRRCSRDWRPAGSGTGARAAAMRSSEGSAEVAASAGRADAARRRRELRPTLAGVWLFAPYRGVPPRGQSSPAAGPRRASRRASRRAISAPT